MTKKCEVCNKDISEKDKFCPNCASDQRPFSERSTQQTAGGQSITIDKRVVGLAGCVILALGVFVPIIKLPIVGSMNYFNNGSGDGVFILGGAVVSLVLILANKYKALFVTSLASLGLLAYALFNFINQMAEIKTQMAESLAGNPFAGLGDLAMQSVQLEWGWIVLIVGAVLLMASAVLDSKGY